MQQSITVWDCYIKLCFQGLMCWKDVIKFYSVIKK